MITSLVPDTRQSGARQVDIDPARLRTARDAILLVAERDPARVDDAAARLFTERFRILGPARALCPIHARTLPPGHLYAFDQRRIAITGIAGTDNRVVAYVEFAGRHTSDTGPCPVARAQGLVILQFRDDRIDEAWTVLRWD